jgi:hypothetical protein
MAEEEEAATTAGSCARLEHHIPIELWTERLMQHGEVLVKLSEDIREGTHSMESNIHILLHYEWFVHSLTLLRNSTTGPLASAGLAIDGPIEGVLDLDVAQFNLLVRVLLTGITITSHLRHGLLLLQVNRFTAFLVVVKVGESSDRLQNDVD